MRAALGPELPGSVPSCRPGHPLDQAPRASPSLHALAARGPRAPLASAHSEPRAGCVSGRPGKRGEGWAIRGAPGCARPGHREEAKGPGPAQELGLCSLGSPVPPSFPNQTHAGLVPTAGPGHPPHPQEPPRPHPQPQGHAPPSARPGSARAGPARRTAWPGPPRTSCRSRTRCRRPPWPGGQGAGSGGAGPASPAGPVPSARPAPPQAPLPCPHHASSVVRGHRALQTVGAVEDEEASLGCRPQLPEQVGLGGPVPRAEGLHDHALQGGLQEGPNLRGQDRTRTVLASCSSHGPAGWSAPLSRPEASGGPPSSQGPALPEGWAEGPEGLPHPLPPVLPAEPLVPFKSLRPRLGWR